MSDDSDDLSWLANAGANAASGSSLYQKASSSLASGAKAEGQTVALGAALGSVVPGIGTVIGAGVGAVVGALVALFDFFKKNPHPGIDDAYWDTLGNEGTKTHEPNGLDISTAQIALVTRFAQAVSSQPNWQKTWPIFWNNIAHSDNPHSSLLADAVARFLGAPQGGKSFNDANAFAALAAATNAAKAKKAGTIVSVGAPLPPSIRAGLSLKNGPVLAPPKVGTAAAGSTVNAGATALGSGSAINLSGLNFGGIIGLGGNGGIAGLGTPIMPLPAPNPKTGIASTAPPGLVPATPAQIVAAAAASPIQVVGTPTITLGQAHQIVASPTPANQGYVSGTAASAAAGHANAIGNMEVLTIAQRLQVEAKYVQRYAPGGAAAAAAIMQGLHTNGG